MDPLSIVAASISIASGTINILKAVHDLQGQTKDIRLNVASLRAQLTLSQATLSQIGELVKTKKSEGDITRPVNNALEVGLVSCQEILHDIDRFANEESVKTLKGKVEYMWNKEAAQHKKQELHVQVQSLSALVTVLQARSLQEQRGQLGRFFGTLGRAKKAAEAVQDYSGAQELEAAPASPPPAYTSTPQLAWSPQSGMSPAASSPPTPGSPKLTRSWTSKVVAPETRRQLSREMIDAAAKGNVKLIDELWTKGGDVNYQSQSETAKRSKMTAVHWAVWEGHQHALEALVDRGAKLDKVMEDGLTALHIAAFQDFPETARYLLSHGADANAKNNLGETALFGVSDQMTAILLSGGAKANERDNDLSTPLHRAAYIGYSGVTNQLLSASAEVNGQDKLGKTALHFASDCANDPFIQDRIALVSSLLEAGGSPNVAARDTGLTPFHEAVLTGHVELGDLFIGRGAAINTRTTTGHTAGHFAAALEKPSMLTHLLKAGMDIEAQTNEKRHTPLHIAIMEGRFATTEALVRALANVETRCSKGYTPLHYAVEGSDVNIVRLLLSAGANPFAKDINSQSQLHCVREVEAAKLLLEAGTPLDARDARNAVPLHTIAQYGSVETVELLLASGNTVDALNAKKQTPLDALCANEGVWIPDPSTNVKVTAAANTEETGVAEKWEDEPPEPCHARLDVVKMLLANNAAVSKECVKSVIAWTGDQPKATVLATLVPKTSGLTKVMIMTNVAVINSGLLSLIKDVDNKVTEWAVAEQEDPKRKSKLGLNRKFLEKQREGLSAKIVERSKNKAETEAGKRSLGKSMSWKP